MADSTKPEPGTAEWLTGGEMGRLIREMDWSRTPLGPIESWPQSLRTTVSLCLASNFPISIAWGPQRTQIYNDGYWPICGDKHPHSMGQDFKECWFSAWPVIGEAFERATAGKTAFLVNQRMFLDRNGYLEETFFTFSFSPIRDESGGVGGLFHPVTELTQQSLAERRLQVLRDLADRTGEAKTVAEACELIAQALARHELDVPFALLYLLDADLQRATLAAITGFAAGSAISPQRVELDAPPHPCWPLAEAARERHPIEVNELEGRFGPLACGPYPEAPQAAMVLPINIYGLEHPFGLLVAGVSSRRALDDAYRTFYLMLRKGVTNALTNARAYEEERKRAEALAELDRAKTAFFTNVSHEFRTPLTLMLGPLEDVLAQKNGFPAADRERLEVAHRNSLRLLKLVNTLLDFSRIEAGRTQAVYEPTDLSAFTAELASVFRSTIEKAGLKLMVDCRPLDELVYVDREMWEKIVLNLLSNAFKFTFDGEIRVALRPAGEVVELVVSDTGTGIPAEELPHVFERFHRVKNARGRSYEGSGIGLALVQELVKLHGGAVAIRSELDRGSEFTVTIPRGAAHLPAERVRQSAARTLASTGLRGESYVEEALRWLPEGGADEVPGPGLSQKNVPAVTPAETRSARILLADDNADMREYARRLLSQGYEVTTVADGAAALRAAGQESFDLVLTDVMMPLLDGFGLLRALRADDRLKTLPVILLSARAGEESRIEGLGAGADDYLTKPFSAKELLARVAARLEIARLRREAEESLRRSEQQLRLVTNSMPALIAYVDSERRYRFNNRAYTEWFGHAPAELEGKHLEEVLGEEAYEALRPSVDAVLSGQTVSFDAMINYKDGGPRYVHINYIPDLGARGEVRGYYALITDLSERRRMEEALRRSHNTFLNLIQKAPFGVYLVDSEFRLAQISAGSQKVFSGIVPLIGRDFAEVLSIVWSEPFANEAINRFRHTLSTGEPYHSPDTTEERGNIRAVESYDWQIERVTMPDGRFGVVCYFYETTARVQAEQDARFFGELAERIRLAEDAEKLLVDVAALTGEYLRLDRCYFAEVDEERDRWSVKEDYHKGVRSIRGEYLLSDYPESLRRDARSGRILISEDTRTDPRSAPLYDISYAPISIRAHADVPLTRDGRWVAALTAATASPRAWQPREISLLEAVAERTWNAVEKLRLDHAVRESEERFRMLADNMSQLAWICDELGETIWYNRRWLDYTGRSFDEMRDWGWKEVHHPDHIDRVVASLMRSRASGEVWEDTFPLRAKTGEYRWFLTRAVPIRDSAGRIVRWFGTNTDITEQRAAQEALREDDRRKDEFLAMLAHELRNPLAPIRNAAQVLKLVGPADANQQWAREVIERQTQYLTRLVDDLLDISRITQGKVTLQREPLELSVIINRAVETNRPSIDARRHQLIVALPPEPLRVEGDLTRLVQVVGNLLNNAAKYTEEGGQIELAVAREGQEAVVRVRDNGLGMAADLLPHIFDLFTQADRSLDRSQGGLGIGLTLVRQLVELHGGRVEARSEGLGQGSEFIVRLPIAPAQAAADGARRVETPPPGAGGRTPLRVLVIEDNVDSAEMLSFMIKLGGHETRLAYDGGGGLAAARAFQPQVILCDIGLPGMNGYEVAQKLRAQPEFRQTRLIALSGYGQDKDRARAKEAGFDYHLVKPVDPDALSALLDSLRDKRAR